MGRDGLARAALAVLIATAALTFVLPRRDSSEGEGNQGAGNAPSISAEEESEIEEAFDEIEEDPPYPREEDGETFRNDERLLPSRMSGYYQAFTVETPGSEDRGERRLVIGGGGEAFYTEDHYESFVVIEPEDFDAQLP